MQAETAPSPAPIRPEAAPRHDDAVARAIAFGVLAVAVIGAPYQFVLPETIKSIAAALAAAIALLLFVWRYPQSRAPLRLHGSHAVPAALALFAVVSTAWSPASTALWEAARWLFIAIVYFVATNVTSRDNFAVFAKSAHYAGLIVSVIALLEFWFGMNIFPAGEASPGSNFGNRNLFAEFLATVFPFSLWLLFTSQGLKALVPRAVGVGLVLVALMATGARAATFTIFLEIVAVVAFVLLRRREPGGAPLPWKLIGAAAAVPVAIVVALAWVPSGNMTIITDGRGGTSIERTVKRLTALAREDNYTGTSSIATRLTVWNAGRGMLAANPVLGVGAGAWNTVSPLYLPDTLDTEYVWMAHNEALQLVAEFGLLGWVALGTVLWLLGASLWSALLRARGGDGELALAQWVTAVAALGFGAVALAGLPLHQAAPTYVVAAALGMLLAFRGTREVAPTQVPAWVVHAGRAAAVALLLATAFVSIQGLRSDLHVRRAAGILNALKQAPQLPPDQVVRYRNEAVAELRKGLDIVSDHGMDTVLLSTLLAELGDPGSVVWLTDRMLGTRPYVAALQCNLARAHSDLGNFPAAEGVLDTLVKRWPRAPCLALSRFVFLSKRGDHAATLKLGQELLQNPWPRQTPAEARFLIEMSYRAAVRIPDVNAAIELLRLRAQRVPQFAAGSYFLMGQLMAQRAGSQVDPQAVEAFRQALKTATPQEAPGMQARLPDAYRAKLQ